MYEIFDMGGRMYIHVPYTENNKCRIGLDRYNYIREKGNLSRYEFLVHIDGDYRNCDPANMYLAKAGEIRRLNRMLSNTTSQEERELCFAINDLIKEIDNRSGHGYSYFSHYCWKSAINADPAKLSARRQKRRLADSKNREHIREVSNAHYREKIKDKDWHERRKEYSRNYQKSRYQDPAYREARLMKQRESRANEPPEAREKRLARRRELRRLHKEEA